ERSASAKTRAADSFSSAHCGGCGAPAEGTSAVCAYCRAPLADVNNGWTLTQMVTRHDAAGRLLLERMRRLSEDEPAATTAPEASAPTPVGVLEWAIRMAASDGVVDASERAGLAQLAARAGVSGDRLDAILADAMAPG